MFGLAGNKAGFDDGDESVKHHRRDRSSTKKSWFPKLTRSAADCFRCREKRKNRLETKNMTEMYYNALQNELRISNPYLNDGRETPTTEIYRQSWKLEPFPALPNSNAEKRRRCRSESNVARNSLLIGHGHGLGQKCPAPADDLAQKKNWLRESKTKLEEMFRKKCRFLAGRKQTSSLSDVWKVKGDGGSKPDDTKLASTSIRQGPFKTNGYFCPIDYGDNKLLSGPLMPNCDPNIWRQKLEKWATSLQCAIQVIKREENLRLEISQLRMHRELLERQLEDISAEKERWRRKCIELQKEKRRSVEGVTCQQCGSLAFQFNDGHRENYALGPLPEALSNGMESIEQEDDDFQLRNPQRDLDDDIFNALHDLILYYA